MNMTGKAMIIAVLAAMLVFGGARAQTPAAAPAAPAPAPAAPAAPAAPPAASAAPAVSAAAAEKAVQLVRQDAYAAVREKYPQINPDDVVAFHRQHAPDLLAEWDRRCRDESTGAKAYFLLLADNFAAIDVLRKDDPDEYERQVKQQATESQVRGLSRQIQALAREGGVGVGAPHRLLTKQRLQLELKHLLEQSFDEAQQRQLIEINRLETEMRNLRRLADERAANRRLILGQRFYILTGDMWPEDHQHDQTRD